MSRNNNNNNNNSHSSSGDEDDNNYNNNNRHMTLSDNEHSDNDRQENNSDNNENLNGRLIDPTNSSKKRIVRNPQIKLNAERLRGKKGVQTIEDYFKGFKWHGKNYEASDLNKIMKRIEHWGHRLYPKYNFDDLLDKLSILGSKREVQVFLTKYRKDMLNDDLISNEINNHDDDDDNNNNNNKQTLEPVDEFDRLIAEQLEKTRQSSSQEPSSSSSSSSKVVVINNNDKENNIFFDNINNKNINSSTIQPKKIINDEETKKRIERNRQMALAKKMSRIKANLETKQVSSSSSELQLQTDNLIDVVSSNNNNNNNDKTNIDDSNVLQQKNNYNNDDDDNNNKLLLLPSNNSTLSVITSVADDSLINSSGKRPLTNEELEQEIDDAVQNFINRKRQSK